MAVESSAIVDSGVGDGSPASKLDLLRESVRRRGSIVIGLSAGVDSALLAKVSFMELGSSAVAVTAVSPSLSSHDRELASENAREIGIRHVLIETNEMEKQSYTANDSTRCFHCKTELSAELWSFARRENFSSVALGVNASDAADFRPGIRAAQESGMCFPLKECGVTKDEVRELARQLGLSAHDRPSNSCLSSRVQYGQKIDERTLRMVEEAEDVLRRLGVRNFRVRVHGNVARIEVDASSLPSIVEEGARKEIVERFRAIGFLYVALDLEGFRSGSMNLPIRSIQ